MTMDRVAVLIREMDAHTPGDTDLEAPRAKMDIVTQLMGKHIPEMGGSPSSLCYEMINAIGPNGNGIAITFASFTMARTLMGEFE